MSPSKTCPKKLMPVRQKCDLSEAAFMFPLKKFWLYLSNTLNISLIVSDCLKTSSKYVITFFLTIKGRKILLIKAEKTAGPMEIPKINL